MGRTTREIVNQDIKLKIRLGVAAWLFAMFGMAAASFNSELQFLPIVGVLIFLAFVLRLRFGGITCPNCGVDLFELCTYAKFRFAGGIQPEFKNCPGCGKDFDEEVLSSEEDTRKY